jgi:hypothetical protein
MIVIICGGRNYHGSQDALIWLDQFHGQFGVERVLHGDAPGADTFGRRWAEDLDIPTQAFPALWDTYGPAAGPRRNAQMAQALSLYPHRAVLAFPGGRGTENMKNTGKQYSISVYEFPGLTPVP